MNKKAGRVAAATLCLAFFAGLADARWQTPVTESQTPDTHTVDFESYRDRSHSELILRLEQHASWCRGKREYAEYKKTLKLILDFDPDNSTALKGLGYRKKGREWVAPKKPKTFKSQRKNQDEEVLVQIDGRYRNLIAPLLEAHTEWVKDGELSDEDRCDALTDILRLDPANPFVATAPLEIRAAAANVLPETVMAKERRLQLRTWVSEGFKGTPESKIKTLLDRDDALGVDWKGVLGTSPFRVVYATDAEEADRLLSALHATDSLFKSLFPKRRGLPRDLTVYLMDSPAQKAAFLKNHPKLTAETRAHMQKLGGSGIPGTRDFAFWEGDEQRRADGIVRMALGWMFKGGFNVSVKTGWAYEGFGLYLTRALVQTRQNWTAQPDPALSPKDDFKLRTKLLQEETNWMQEAHDMWRSSAPDLGELMGRNVNQLSSEDILASYVLAAYLIEGQPQKMDSFLRMTGSRLPLEEQVRRVFGWDLATLEGRAGRWLSERH